MSRWLAIAEKAATNPNSVPDILQEPATSPLAQSEVEFLQVSTVCREGNSEKNRNRPDLIKPDIAGTSHPKIAPRSEGVSPYGTSPGGRPLTHTGKVVSLDAWRQLTEWEKHGSKGKVWNGVSREWEGPQ